MKISIIIPNYNRSTDLRKCLNSIINQGYTDYEVIVVDDASTDSSVEILENEYPAVRICEHEKNKGPSFARHTGALVAKGDIFIFIDTDAVFTTRDSLERVSILFEKKKEYSCFAFRILNTEKKDDLQRWWHTKDVSRYSCVEFETKYFSGTCFAVDRQSYHKSGGFPLDIFMFNEEVELSLRLLKNGIKILYYPYIEIIHYASLVSRNSKIAFYYKRRNQIVMVYKYYPLLRGLFFILPRIFVSFFQSILTNNLKQYLLSIKDAFVIIHEAERCVINSAIWVGIKKL